jgi:hypothetical protein
MTALGLHHLVPASLLAGRWVVVLVVYLDDSGKDPQSRITTLAGYAATAEQWKMFESEVEPWFTEFGVNILHAKKLESTKCDFAGWTVLRKQAFVARICQVMSRHVAVGYSMSVVKETYRARAKESSRKRTVTPYTICFNKIVDWVLADYLVGREANINGVSFILECGHENNPEVEKSFDELKTLQGLSALRSISFVCKDDSRAIQIADLLAFYSRRTGAALESAPVKERRKVRAHPMMNLIGGAVPHRSFVATDFDQPPDETSGPPPLSSRLLRPRGQRR